jgi:hypothetical protein
MSLQNMPRRSGYTAVSILVDGTARQLAPIVEQILGYTAGSFATIFREVTIQLDPEVSSGAQVRFGNGNVGQTLTQTTPSGSVVQKGMTLGAAGGYGETMRATVNAVYFGSMWAQTVSGTAVLNLQLWDM